MSRRGTALGGIVAILATLVAAAGWQAPRIERGLAERARQDLAARGITGVEVRFDGRDAVLAGPGVTDTVRELVGREPGVRRVRVAGAGAGAPGGTAPGGTPTVASTSHAAGELTGTAAEPASQVAQAVVDLLGPEGLRFEPDTENLGDGERRVLERVAAVLTAYPGVRLLIAGYTDAQSPPDLTNLELSRRRAEAVAAVLVAHGVAAGRLSVVGYGDQHPVGDNGTATGRAANRRVEITVLGG
jgi:outer membrane protein OmpA-like peptidoglycan-associated protein